MRVLIADASAKARSAIGLLLSERAGAHVVGRAGCADDLLALASTVRPDVLVMDWELRAGRCHSGPAAKAEILEPLRRALPRMRIVALSARPEERERAFAAGVDAFVAKGEPPSALIEAVGVTRD
jgi:DNA-binding NarL/FixJ family response regulator